MKQIKYEDGILTFSVDGKEYKTDYELNIERLDGRDCIGEFTKKDKVRLAQRLMVLKAIGEGKIKDIKLFEIF